jgi:hypothetical protein
MPRRLTGELLGTSLLLAAVVGSGIMGERLSGGNVAIALLANTLAAVTRADGHSRCYIHGRKQRRDAVTLVVV